MVSIKYESRMYCVFLCLFSFFPLIAKAQSPFFSTSLTTFYGGNRTAEKDKSSLIEKSKNEIDWKKASFKTDNLTTLRITDLNSGVWNILPSSQFEILDSQAELEENPFRRSAKLFTGRLRFKASGDLSRTEKEKKEEKRNVVIITNELQVFVPQGADVVISRIKNLTQNKYVTSIYSLNGQIYLLSNKNLFENKKELKNEEIPLAAGLIFSIFEDGVVAPLTAPSGSDIEQIVGSTTTGAEFLAKQYYAEGLKLNELLDKCASLEKNSDYFEILNLFDALKNDFKNNAQVPYCLGIANEGLGQKSEAIKYFKASILLQPNYVDAHWHLAQLYLQEKNFVLARKEFGAAYKNIDHKDKRYTEYNYYIGVIDFFEQKYLDSKSLFTSCVWDKELDPALKQSASEFLAKIPIDKPWSLLLPFGFAYDDNVFSLAHNESLPSNYSSKSAWKTFMGGVFDYDSSLPTQKDGWFLGGEAKTFYVKNLNRSYKALDALVLEGTVFETMRWQEKEKKDVFRFYQTNGLIYVDNLRDTYYFLAGIKYKYFDINVGTEKDISQRPSEEKRSSAVFNQYYADNYGQFGSFMFNLNSQMQEKITSNRTDLLGNSFEIIASPSLIYLLSQTTNISFTQTLDFIWTNSTPMTRVYKFQPIFALNYFFTRWLLGTASGIYELDLEYPQAQSVIKPQATFSLTGLF